MSHKRISVIIPTYNHAQFIKEALDSVFAQTFQDFEVHVINDGSTDQTDEILSAYKDKIHYHRTNRVGVGAARNYALRQSTGEYIALLDSDDIWHADFLQKQLDSLKNHPDWMGVFADCIEFDKNGIVESTFKRDYFDVNNVFESLLISNRVPCPSFIFKRSLLDEVGLFDEDPNVCEDWDLLLRITQHHKIGFRDEILVKKRQHATNLSAVSDKLYINSIITLERAVKKLQLSGRDKKVIRKTLGEICGDLAYLYYAQLQNVKARHYFGKQIHYSGLKNFRAVGYYFSTFLGAHNIEKLKNLKTEFII